MFNLNEFFQNVEIDINNAKTIEDLDQIRIKCLGKKGILTNYIKGLKILSFEEKRKNSVFVNKIKKSIFLKINRKYKMLEQIILNQRIQNESIDVSLPGRRIQNGFVHPITHTINDIKNFFFKIGFQSINSLEIEDEYHNFDALNIPKNHPARDTHDTFWFDDNRLLRTQTSSVQIRVMKQRKPPIRLIFPGKVYRNDYDPTHTPMFHQIEGLIVEKNINFSNLKWIIYCFLNDLFNNTVSIKFRPSYFPFTTPSAEVDIISNSGKKLEILGCGMVHPCILSNMKIDSKRYAACAFGIGVERITMLRYGIADIRSLFENDIRFLKQFKQ
jgi:phenylalanyl-tRNA synthetase alpha chain